jgi:hypothetical protein
MSFAVVDLDRTLAKIVAIDSVFKHSNANALSIIYIGGWQCVVKLDEYEVGDKALYCEIDALLPLEHPSFSFLASRTLDTKVINDKSYHRLKSIKIRGEISQGLVIPVPTELQHLPVGTDVTQALNILKFELNSNIELTSKVDNDVSWLSKFANWVSGVSDVELKPWPSLLQKSKQNRLQNSYSQFEIAKANQDTFEVSYKLDGASMTVFMLPDTNKMPGYHVGVASRNNEIPLNIPELTLLQQFRYWLGNTIKANRRFFYNWTPQIAKWRKYPRGTENPYSEIESKLNIINKLIAHWEMTGEYLTVQGEMVGPDIEQNSEGVNELQFYVYTVYVNGNKPLLPEVARTKAEQLGLDYIPLLHERFVIPKDWNIQDLIRTADGPRVLVPVKGKYREGIVLKCNTKLLSWKIISNMRLLKQEEHRLEII